MAKKNKQKPIKSSGNDSGGTGSSLHVLVNSNINQQSLLGWMGIAALLTFIAFFPALKNDFVNWDDNTYVTQNPLLKDLSFKGLKAIFSTPVSFNYHPVTILSLAFNYKISGLGASSYIFTNLLFHCFNTLLVFYFIFLLSGKKTNVAFIVSLIFGIHPMHVESVAWVSERKDVLYTFFMLPALILYLDYLKRPGNLKYFGILLLFILSLLSKPAAVIFPMLLLLIDYYTERKSTVLKLLIEKIPFFILSLTIGILTFQIQEKAIAMERFSSFEHFLFGCYGFVNYIFKLFIPVQLSALHPYPISGSLDAIYYLSPLLVAAVFAIAWYFRKNKSVIFGLGFYLVSIILVLQVITVGNAVIAERYSYFPYIGLAFMLSDLYFNWTSKQKNSSIAKNSLILISVIITLVFLPLTFQQTKVWNNTLSLWNNVIEKYPDSYRAYMSRGREYVYKNKFDLALQDLNRSLELNPIFTHSIELRGITYYNLHKYELALIDLEKWQKDEPNNSEAYNHLGLNYIGLNRHEDAFKCFNQAISIQPNNAKSYLNRGTLYFNYYKDANKALQDFDQSVKLDPNYSGAYVNRANCYFVLQNKEKVKENIAIAQQKGANVPSNLLEFIK